MTGLRLASGLVHRGWTDRFWVVQRPDGRWTLPSAHLGNGEYPLEAVERAIRQTLGMEATLQGLLGVYPVDLDGTEATYHLFRHYSEDEPRLGHGLLAAEVLSWSDIVALEATSLPLGQLAERVAA